MRDEGAGVIEKLGTATTIIVSVVVWDFVPPVPVTVTMYVPIGVLGWTMIVRVVVDAVVAEGVRTDEVRVRFSRLVGGERLVVKAVARL